MDYAHIVEFLRESGLALDGGLVLHRVVRFASGGGNPLRIDEVFVPVREA